MIIIGCDYHPSFQQIAFVDTETGELQERRLQHREEAEKFYRDLAARGMAVRVGMEASGHARWFERLLAELQFELWIGDAAEISAKRVRKQKTDRQDAQLILRLVLKDATRTWQERTGTECARFRDQCAQRGTPASSRASSVTLECACQTVRRYPLPLNEHGVILRA